MKRRSLISALGAATITGVHSAAPETSATICPDKINLAEPATAESLPLQMRIVAWNVACGQWCTPAQVSEAMLDDGHGCPDLVLLNEVPKFNQGVAAPDWSGEVARRLGLNYYYVGSISSANH